MNLVVKFLGGIAVIVGFSLLIAFPVMWLWNWLMPMIFGLIELNIWEALGVSLLSNALFKGSSSSKK